MPLKTTLFLSVVCLGLLGIGGGLRWNAVRAEVPKPDFENLTGYQRALETSTNPTAKAILQQIENGPADLARERAAAQREGILLDVKQLQRPMPPATENAAPLYAQWEALRRKIKFRPTWSGASLSIRYAYTPAQIAAVQKVLDDNPQVMALLHQATDKPQCVFAGDDWKDIATKGVPFSHTARLREAAREINTESYLLARQGWYSEAIADQSRGFRIAEQIASEPSLINYLVSIAIEAITLQGLESILDLAGPNADAAQRVQQAISMHHARLSLKRTLSGEVAVTLASFDLFPRSSPADLASFINNDGAGLVQHTPGRFSPDERKFLTKMIAAAEAEYIHQMRHLISVADGPSAARKGVVMSIVGQSKSSLNPINMLVNQELSLLPEIVDTNSNRHDREQCLLAGATVLAVKVRAGVFPGILPGNFTDAFHNDQSLKYRREGTRGFVVYSVGPTGKFNGGKPGDDDWQPTTTEIAFRYPGPMPKPVPPDILK